MRKKNMRSLLFIFSFAVLTTACHAPPLAPVPPDILRKSREFQAIRSIRGHFEGKRYHADIDRWMGKKHRLMIDLASYLSSSEDAFQKVTELMGKPDRILTRTDEMFFPLILQSGKHDESRMNQASIHLYLFRGMHDFLYLIRLNGTPFALNWYHAKE